MTTTTRTSVDLSNLAFTIKEIVRQVQALNEEERETLEILLDDGTLAAIEESDQDKAYVSRQDVFGDVYPSTPLSCS
jgi:hypothetical protein